MSSNQIIEKSNLGIAKRKYISGKETQYHILTIKMDSHRYLVKLLDGSTIVDTSDINGRLDAAKQEGIRLLLQYSPTAESSDVTMVHYKDDRPNGLPWQKDNDKVVYQLLTKHSSNLMKNINFDRLDIILKQFAAYRAIEENHYQANERQYKVELLGELGVILHNVHSDPNKTRNNLIQLVAGFGDNKNKTLRKYLHNLLAGHIWLEDFLVFLENTDSTEFSELLMDLFEQGITADIRERFISRYKTLFTEGKFASTKKNIENTPVQLLAILMAAYDPNEYMLYRPNDYATFVSDLGITAPNDVIERYELYKQVSHLTLRYAKDKGYPLDDLIDVYNVVYLYSNNQNLFSSDNSGNSNQQGDMIAVNPNQAINKILYGPPGTGKTYNVIYEALSILIPNIDHDLLNNPKRRTEAVSLFNRYVDSNQVMFCTFHQSYSYEEFVEGIRFSLNGDKQYYEVRDGVFKKICNAARAVTSERKQTYNFDPDNTQIFKMSLGNTLTSDNEVYDYCLAHNVIALGWGEDVDFSRCKDKQAIRDLYYAKYPDEPKFGIEAVERFKHWMKPGDLVVISNGNTKARAIGKITGDYTYNVDTPIDYYHFRSVEWLYSDNTVVLPVQSILRDKIFSQQTIYLFNNKDINMESIQELVSGNRTKSKQEQQFVLVIDEINRGNISKIFGELITLIEPDKRLGQPNEIPVSLPYSGDRLRVPSNLHILGTMNTADRSIALLDTALRRRFEFMEMMPDYNVLPTDVEGINIRLILKKINERIEYLFDRDHVIGHSYFITDNPSLEEYIRIMKVKVIPLLQEYFYEDWEQIEQVLGGAGKQGDRAYLLNRMDVAAGNLFANPASLSEPRKTRYTVQPDPTIDALKRIYSTVKVQTEEDDEE